MSLVTREVPPHVAIRRQALRLAGLVSLGMALFVVLLAAAAWFTRDTPRGVPHDEEAAVAPLPTADAGAVDGAPVVTPAADAGEIVTVAGDVDAGPAEATPPPIDETALANAILGVAQGCLEEVLRFDPSLGGRAVIEVAIGAHTPVRATLSGIPSPLFSRCVLARIDALSLPTPEERVRVAVALSIDGLRGEAVIERTTLSLDVTPP